MVTRFEFFAQGQEISMNSIKLCALLVAAAFAAPVLAQKAIGGGEVLLGTPKPSIIPKLDVALPPPPAVLPAKPVSALSTSGIRDLLPAVDKKDIGGAAIPLSDLKPNIDLKGLPAQRPGNVTPPEGGAGATDPKIAPPGSGEGGGGGAFAGTKARMMGLEGEKGGDLSNSLMMGEGRSVGSGANEAIKNAVGNTGPIDGAKYGDTFGGDRVNRKSQGSLNSFAGGGKGRASDGSGAEAGSAAGGTVVPTGGNAAGAASGMAGAGAATGQEDGATVGGVLNGEGGRSSGNAEKGTVELLGRAQLQGADGYAATKGMTQTQRKAYWAQQSGKQKKGYERDDSMGSTGGPMTREELKTNQRGLAGRTGGAGGSNDGRGEQGSSTSATGGGIAVITNKADRPERVEGAGTLNMDAALKINTLVNPGATSASR
jgi:hypothetical protein